MYEVASRSFPDVEIEQRYNERQESPLERFKFKDGRGREVEIGMRLAAVERHIRSKMLNGADKEECEIWPDDPRGPAPGAASAFMMAHQGLTLRRKLKLQECNRRGGFNRP